MSYLYDRDFYGWTKEQSALLRAGHLSDADIQHIVEELESLGRSEKKELTKRLTVLLKHLLKWQHQPSHRGNSWRLSIQNARIAIKRHMRDNPSLKPEIGQAMDDAYETARLKAAIETGLDEKTFPIDGPWSFTEVLDDKFWPN